MKNAKESKTKLTLRSSKPQKFLLHMARKDNNWAGRVTRLGSEDEYRFDGLEDLWKWLRESEKSEEREDQR